ncbi:hypothetical protein COCSUDRAFT_83563 [Coccomyxa subellipsoidea C-169]|uniref:UDENN domain-containing protein n=1 Tax=Coccomyxa subellipsoidea (strain C-169) TaxID=574566 RepID=I0YM93_COCSC|nr:hypothetical protein COCSUDRAFT_83563 [Coccomyxa subellipsoidea C-169]EIE19512.1 hypothetical protein COCSUDRAFT_83563 [Coccomyxa subellipsoidea C-169]|eukprot:XP_005644056.1 hypothetical protein COCSUDRAFT_83563 [Coccomyxa subellipsoidea C-169]
MPTFLQVPMVHEYSFTLTGGDGSRLHGFCRSFLPPRARLKSLRYPQVLQVLEAMLKQTDLLNGPAHASLPYASPASQFLENLSISCTGKLVPGEVLRLPLPRTPAPVNVSPPRRIGVDFQSGSQPPLRSTEQWVELEVPPDAGNGAENAGLPLARLLWHLSPSALVGLIEALLLERRVLMVAQERDTVSAAVHAAAALLHPLKWQHIYLPLLPLALKDYLSAPMPFLMGVHSPNLFMSTLRSSAMEEVVVVDLDRGTTTCSSLHSPRRNGDSSGSGGGSGLPWGRQLEAALALLHQTLRSPEYMVKLLGSYREFVEKDVPGSPAPVPEANGAGPRIRHQDDGYIRQALPPMLASHIKCPYSTSAHGYRFNHAAFVASFHSAKARAFLEQLRQSQCYEVFFNERLRLASDGVPFGDPFEVAAAAVKRGKISKSIANASAKGVSRVNAIIQRTSKAVKNYRHGTTEQAAAQNDRYQKARPARPMTPPVVTIPANHQFLSEDESSSSGSDSEAAPAADGRRPQAQAQAQARAQMRVGPLPVQSASAGPGPPRALGAPPGDPPSNSPSGNGEAAAASTSYYMPVVDRPSLLDLATEVPAARAVEGGLSPSLLDMDWALPGAGVDLRRIDRSAEQAVPSQQASAEQPGFSNGSPPNKAVPAAGFGSDAAFASAEPQPFATNGANSGSSPQDRAGQGGVLPWVEVDSVQASPKIRHTDSWTEWTLGAPALEAQRACNLQQNPLVSLLDL